MGRSSSINPGVEAPHKGLQLGPGRAAGASQGPSVDCFSRIS